MRALISACAILALSGCAVTPSDVDSVTATQAVGAVLDAAHAVQGAESPAEATKAAATAVGAVAATGVIPQPYADWASLLAGLVAAGAGGYAARERAKRVQAETVFYGAKR